MRHLTVVLAVVASLLFAASLAYADVNPYTNPGFETGDVTGWTMSSPENYGYLYMVNNASDGFYTPAAGNYYLSMAAIDDGGLDPETDIYQNMTLKAGDVLQGWAALAAYPGGGGAVEIFSGGTQVATPWSAAGAGALDPWTEWTWTVPTGGAGTYRLDYQVTTGGNGNENFGFFDAQDPSVSTPEPGSCTLFLALLPLGAWLRRKRRA